MYSIHADLLRKTRMETNDKVFMSEAVCVFVHVCVFVEHLLEYKGAQCSLRERENHSSCALNTNPVAIANLSRQFFTITQFCLIHFMKQTENNQTKGAARHAITLCPQLYHVCIPHSVRFCSTCVFVGRAKSC